MTADMMVLGGMCGLLALGAIASALVNRYCVPTDAEPNSGAEDDYVPGEHRTEWHEESGAEKAYREHLELVEQQNSAQRDDNFMSGCGLSQDIGNPHNW